MNFEERLMDLIDEALAAKVDVNEIIGALELRAMAMKEEYPEDDLADTAEG